MATSYIHGHKVICTPPGLRWRFMDNGQYASDRRPCPRCGEHVTKEGHDSCLGTVNGVRSACCGHGVYKPYRVTELD